MSSDLASIFWPPTVMAGILILSLTLVVARAYPYVRKRLKYGNNATVRFNDESFFLRGLATGISLSSLLVQASNVEPFAALSGAGIGQLYIALGLLIASGILVSNLKQRLDSYVIPLVLAESKPTGAKTDATQAIRRLAIDDAKRIALERVFTEHPDARGKAGISSTDLKGDTWHVTGSWRRATKHSIGVTLFEIVLDAKTGEVLKSSYPPGPAVAFG
jgi:hypothetical protein